MARAYSQIVSTLNPLQAIVWARCLCICAVLFQTLRRALPQVLAERAPCFEALKVVSAWSAYYDYNPFDQNAFMGRVAGHDGVLLACGHSGHGASQRHLSCGGSTSLAAVVAESSGHAICTFHSRAAFPQSIFRFRSALRIATGIQQAIATGRAVSELVLDGEYTTLDLQPFSYDRYSKGEKMLERNIV